MKTFQLFIFILLCGLASESQAQANTSGDDLDRTVHTVLFKFVPQTTSRQIDEMMHNIKGLTSTITGISKVSCGSNF